MAGGAPLAARLLERDVVLWRDGAGAVHAFADRCPHRGTRLSLGRVVAGADGASRLECAYHGWQFAAGGQCVAIPALPALAPPASHAACRFDACEAHGLLWVRLQAGDSGVPAFEAEADPALRKLLCGPFDVATSAPRIVENFLDIAHFGFVHEGWLGDRAHLAVDAYTVEATATGLVASGCRAWQPRSHASAGEGAMVDYRYEVTSPFSAVLRKLPQTPGAGRDEIALFICPVEPAQSRVWFRIATSDLASSDAELRAFQHTIFAQDRPLLESQTPKQLPLTAAPAGGEIHCAADRASTAYRRFLHTRGITFGVLR